MGGVCDWGVVFGGMCGGVYVCVGYLCRCECGGESGEGVRMCGGCVSVCVGCVSVCGMWGVCVWGECVCGVCLSEGVGIGVFVWV